MNIQYYKSSGKVSEFFIPYFILLVALSVPILSIAYIYLIYYIPIIYFNVLITIGSGYVFGGLIAHTVRFGKARNPLLVHILTAVAICLFKYIQWCVYIPLVVSEAYGFSMTFAERFSESVYYLIRPGEVYEAMRIINEYGVWSFSKTGTVITGVVLLGIWIAEFAIIAASAFSAVRNLILMPYSEASDGWYVDMADSVETDMPEYFESLRRDLENGNYIELIKLAEAPRSNPAKSMRVTFCKPPQGAEGEPHYMSISQVVMKKGKANTKSLLKYLSIDPHSIDLIVNGEEPGEDIDFNETFDDEADGVYEDDSNDVNTAE